MNEPTMETLTRRLDRVERENRRLKKAGVAALAVIAVVVLMGQGKASRVAKVVEAEKFVLRDLSGKRRAVLGLSKDAVELNLLGKNGKNLARLTASDFASMLFLNSNGGYPRVVAGVLAGLATVTLEDKDGRTRAELALSSKGRPHLFVADNSGKGGAWLSENRNGWIKLSLFDKGKTSRAELVLAPDGSPSLYLNGEDGKHRAALGAVLLEKPQTGVIEMRPASSLVFLNKAGKVTWSAP